MTSPQGRFVGIAVDHYQSTDLPDLPRPVANVHRVRDLLGDNYAGDPLTDPTEDDVSSHLRLVAKEDAAAGAVIAMWSGHGEPPPHGRGLRLLAADSARGKATAGFSPGDVLGACVDTKAAQILLIVDTCYSGAAMDALADAAAVLEAVSGDSAAGRWIGVLTACSPLVTADDGVFSEHLCRVLEYGPTVDSTYHRDWSVHNKFVSGHALCAAVLEEWPSTVEPAPRYRADIAAGLSTRIIRNRLWREDAPAAVVEHLLRAARSGSDPLERSWFTGRTDEVDRVVSWVTGGAPGVFVITGSAGTGKSAILGRVVSASVPGERARLLAQNPDLGHTDPGPGSVTANAHARGVTVNRLAEQLNADLEIAGILARSDTGPRNGNELLGALERAAQSAGDTWRPPVLAVDGLDEARDQAFDLASELMLRLGRWCTVIVSTRNLPARTVTGTDLLDTLGALGNRLDLDDPVVAVGGRETIRRYVVERLGGGAG